MGVLSSVYNCFNTPKRQEVLLSKIASIETNTKATRLKNLCPTRWIQRHELVLIFLELQNAVTISLETISSWQDKTTCSTALQLLSAIQNVEFQISLRTTAKIFGITSPLSRLLQTENLDLSTAMILATNIEEMLIKMRNDSEKEFNYIFNDVQKICSDWDVDVKIPRKVGRQVHRSNIETDSPEVYFRVSIFIPFLDFFITQIQRRLLDHKQILSSFHCLLPSKINNLEFKKQFETDIVHLVRRYEKIVNCSEEQSIGELRLWWNYVSQMNDNLKNAHSALLVCDEKIFPIIRKLLVILVTLPVTTATPERTFSTLRRLKTYLRNTTGESRLNGLGMLNIHRNIEISTDAVLDELSKSSRRINIKL
uniref:Repressor of the inhibitor of the protein kinase n=1 Tax=Schizaphis graminum TaxID=13262 RepID=A0A2S2PK90_SCHGA